MLAYLSRFKHRFSLIANFIAGQGSVQILNLATGFLLLRWLSIEAYAQYSVAFGFQCTLGILIDLGFSSSIIALVGDRGSDKAIVGAYIRAGKYFRYRLFIILIPLAAIAFPLITFKQHWDWRTQILLFISIISSLFFQGWVSYYSAPLLINQRLKEFYQPQIVGASSRILLNFTLYSILGLSAWIAAWLNSAAIAINSLLCRIASTSFIIEPKHSDSIIQREMLKYLSPFIPSIIFTALQGQISLLLITLFGETKTIAEVAALGRLGQLFLVLTAFNSVVIEPYIAKVARQYLVKRYFQVLGTAILISLTLCILAFLFPQPLLWLLGSKYQDLQLEASWIVVVSCINYISGVMWTMHSARKWVYWWHSTLYIMLILLTQVVYVVLFKLDTTLNVIYFSLATSGVTAITHIIGGIYGFMHGYRKAELLN